MKKRQLIMVGAMLCLWSGLSMASSQTTITQSTSLLPDVTRDAITHTQQTNNDATKSSTALSDIDLAKVWQLTPSEWQQYKSLMQGPSGHWYAHLDPDEVLGINAQTEQERDYYAEHVVKAAHARVDAELAFQRAYDRAQQKLFGHLPVIGEIPNLRDFDHHKTDSGLKLSAGDRLYLFTTTTNIAGTVLFDQLYPAIKRTADTHIDLYFVAPNNSDSNIRTWAKTYQISPNAVSQSIITLNQDDGSLKRLGGDIKYLPQLYLKRGDTITPVSLMQLQNP